jgi:hypothetical protein
MPYDTPVALVIQMRNQGLSNNQIVQNLSRQGYTNTQIFDAMNQADMKSSVIPTDISSSVPQAANPMTGFQQQQEDFSQSNQQQDYEYQYPAQENVTTEELVESIIEEKWGDLIKDVNKIIDWKTKTETRITSLEQKFNDLKESFDQLHRAVVGKVSEYDKHILEVGAEIKAMEKVFQKVLPSFTDNVNELSRIVDKVKKNPAK